MSRIWWAGVWLTVVTLVLCVVDYSCRGRFPGLGDNASEVTIWTVGGLGMVTVVSAGFRDRKRWWVSLILLLFYGLMLLPLIVGVANWLQWCSNPPHVPAH